MLSKAALSAVGLLLLLLSHFSAVEANSLFIPIKVVDCDGVTPLKGVSVSLYGCVDSTIAAGARANTSAAGIIRTTGDDGFVVGNFANPPSACPNAIQTEFAYGSANGQACEIAVVDDTTKAVLSTYSTARLFSGTGLTQWALDNIIVCKNTVFTSTDVMVKANTAPCASTQACYNTEDVMAPVPDTVVLRRSASGGTCCAAPSTYLPAPGATAYGFFCPAYTATPQAYPTSMSFRSNQLFPSTPSVQSFKAAKWGWQIVWPTKFTEKLTGTLYGDQYKPVGDITAKVTYANSVYTLDYTYTMKAPNTIGEIHVYFNCTQMTTGAPGQYNSNPATPTTGAPTFSGIATTTAGGCAAPQDGQYLYMSFHATVTPSIGRRLRL